MEKKSYTITTSCYSALYHEYVIDMRVLPLRNYNLYCSSRTLTQVIRERKAYSRKKEKHFPHRLVPKLWIRKKTNMTFWNFIFVYGKHFSTSPYEYSNEWIGDVKPSLFFIIIYYTYKLDNFHFLEETDKSIPCLEVCGNKHNFPFSLGR